MALGEGLTSFDVPNWGANMKPMIDGDPVERPKIDEMDSVFEKAAEALRDAEFRAKHTIADVAESIVASSVARLLVGYRHPVHRFKNWTVISKVELVVPFLRDRINPKKGFGLDMDIASEDFTHLWSTTHDGDAYQLR